MHDLRDEHAIVESDSNNSTLSRACLDQLQHDTPTTHYPSIYDPDSSNFIRMFQSLALAAVRLRFTLVCRDQAGTPSVIDLALRNRATLIYTHVRDRRSGRIASRVTRHGHAHQREPSQHKYRLGRRGVSGGIHGGIAE